MTMEAESPTLGEHNVADNEPMSAAGETTEGTPKADSSPAPPVPPPADMSGPPASKKIEHGSAAPTPAAPTPKKSNSIEEIQKDLSKLVNSGVVSMDDAASILEVLKDYAGLKEKVDKLKSLLGRSAKAQRESKVDLDATQKRLSQALREIERLNQKLDKLQSRPTHSEYFLPMFCF